VNAEGKEVLSANYANLRELLIFNREAGDRQQTRIFNHGLHGLARIYLRKELVENVLREPIWIAN
jgi:hypothetical protein